MRSLGIREAQEAMEAGVSYRETWYYEPTAWGEMRRETAPVQQDPRRRMIAENAKSKVR
jgi:hypothetical protein